MPRTATFFLASSLSLMLCFFLIFFDFLFFFCCCCCCSFLFIYLFFFCSLKCKLRHLPRWATLFYTMYMSAFHQLDLSQDSLLRCPVTLIFYILYNTCTVAHSSHLMKSLLDLNEKLMYTLFLNTHKHTHTCMRGMYIPEFKFLCKSEYGMHVRFLLNML